MVSMDDDIFPYRRESGYWHLRCRMRGGRQRIWKTIRKTPNWAHIHYKMNIFLVFAFHKNINEIMYSFYYFVTMCFHIFLRFTHTFIHNFWCVPNCIRDVNISLRFVRAHILMRKTFVMENCLGILEIWFELFFARFAIREDILHF